jgi:8-oxo-dGTP pyrophosphatase MutT (NUDIX family)
MPAVYKEGMGKDQSYGIIIFRETSDGRQYLVLTKKSGTDFPKGHAEVGENPEETARRETKEEAGLDDIELIPGYHEDIHYILSQRGHKVFKTVTYFLGRAHSGKVKVSHEHKGYKWCSPEQAIRLVRFPEQKALIRKAQTMLR